MERRHGAAARRKRLRSSRPPMASATVPDRDAFVVCANADAAINKRIKMQKINVDLSPKPQKLREIECKRRSVAWHADKVLDYGFVG